MRVIAGIARSLPLRTPAGTDTRPTTDRIKETLFNILQTDIPGCVFVDLFSGSGGIGIEALSRGARKAYFVENDHKAFNCIQENLRFTKLDKSSMIMKADVCMGISRIDEAADIVFMDPPYESGLDLTALKALRHAACINEDTLVIVEASLGQDTRDYEACGFTLVKEKVYKTNKHVFLTKEGDF